MFGRREEIPLSFMVWQLAIRWMLGYAMGAGVGELVHARLGWGSQCISSCGTYKFAKLHLPAFYGGIMSLQVKMKGKADAPVIFTTSLGRLFGPVWTASILRSVSMPSMTLPKTTCFPSRNSHFAVVMKNWGGGCVSLRPYQAS
jgi:hypothetical protein